MFEVPSITHIGNRAENQDATKICELKTGTLAVLADGAGGHQDGALAAQSLCRHLIESATHHEQEIADITFCADQKSVGYRTARQLIEQIITQATAAMSREVTAKNPQTNAHTTLVLCWASVKVTLFAHVGDSRAYLLNDASTEFRSKDHSMAQWKLENGEITESELRGHPDRHLLYRMIATGKKPAKPSFTMHPTLSGQQCVLLCSDGWWEHILTAEMITHCDQKTLAPWLQCLAAKAVERAAGSSDNVTAIALRLSPH